VSSALAFAAVCTTAAPAHAWVEQAVKSDSVTLDVERDGRALVTHEMMLWVRGGPLPQLSVEPIDADAVLEEGATATRAQSGKAAGFPVPLEGSTDGARLTLRIVGEKGLRTGTHLIRFAYRTSLAGPDHLHAGPSGTSLVWTGPSFVDGIDSAKVVFRLPPASSPPRLGSGASSGAGATEEAADDHGGVFLSTFRRAGDKDELEVVRPHVAKNERVSWRILADSSTFDVTQEIPVAPPKVLSPGPTRRGKPAPVWPWWVAVSALASIFGAAVALKSRWVLSACRKSQAIPRPLLSLPTPLRAILAATSVLGAAALVFLAYPLAAATTLMVALAAASHLPTRASAPLRGPGKWTELDPEVAFEERPAPRLPGRYVDAGTGVGFVLFVSLLALFVAVAIVVMRRSEYYGLSIALGSALLFPIFCTGRAGELPPDPVVAPLELLDWLSLVLAKDASLTVRALGRVPLGKTEHDEIRLLVLPKRPMAGFVAIEAGLDVHQGALGLLSLPFVLVRVVEGSPASEALPKGLFWTRGRNVDERVAVLRPKVPTRKLTASLVAELSHRLSLGKSSAPARRQGPSTSAAKSAGKESVTSKPSTTSSPAHAT
jgi:hypothetical protein